MFTLSSSSYFFYVLDEHIFKIPVLSQLSFDSLSHLVSLSLWISLPLFFMFLSLCLKAFFFPHSAVVPLLLGPWVLERHRLPSSQTVA